MLIRKALKSPLLALLILSLAAVLLPSAVSAQYVTLENGYIGVAIGQAGWYWDGTLPHVLGNQGLGGRFDIWTTGGDPNTDYDNGQRVVYSPLYPPAPGDKWAAWQVLVDTYEDEADLASRIWATYPEGGTSALWGEIDDGIYTIDAYTPTYNDRTILGQFYPLPDDGFTPIKSDLEVKLMRDTVRFKWTLTNQDYREHLVGLRVYADFAPNPDDGGTRGYRTVVSVPGLPLIEDRTVLFGKDIPDVLEMFNSSTNPIMGVRATLRGQGATPPDVVGIDDWAVVAGTGWTYGDNWQTVGFDTSWLYQPEPWQYINDVAYGAFWKPVRIAPNGKREIIHYIGLASATSDFTKPNMNVPQYVIAAQAPRALKYYRDDLGVGRLHPSPLKIDAYVENTEKHMDLENVSLTLLLPNGLVLDSSENGKFTKTISRVTAGSERSVSWNVVPVNHPTGILKYSISASTAPAGGTVLERTVNVPATEVQPLSAGWQMISIPFAMNNPDPVTSLGLQPYVTGAVTAMTGNTITDSGKNWVTNALRGQAVHVISNSGGGVYNITGNTSNTLMLAGVDISQAVDIGDDYEIHLIWRYDTYAREYKPVSALVPGEGYWLKLNQSQLTAMTPGQFAPIQWAGTSGTQVPLTVGWNLIGNPYVYTVTLGELRFYHRDFGTIGYDEAVLRGLISRSVFWWDPIFRRYDWSNSRTVQLKPWQGYWVRSLRAGTTIIITPDAQIGAAVEGLPIEGDDGGNGGDGGGGGGPQPPPAPGGTTGLIMGTPVQLK